MRNTRLFILLFLFINVGLPAQSLTVELNDSEVLKVENDIVVYGKTGEKPEEKFVVIRYDKNLKEVKRYSKTITRKIKQIYFDYTYEPSKNKMEQLRGLYSGVITSETGFYNGWGGESTLFFQIPHGPGLWDATYIKLDFSLNELFFVESSKSNYKSLFGHEIFQKKLVKPRDSTKTDRTEQQAIWIDSILNIEVAGHFKKGTTNEYVDHAYDENGILTVLCKNKERHASTTNGRAGTMSTISSYVCTYFAIILQKNGEYVYKNIPDQVLEKGIYDSTCFLAGAESVFKYVPGRKNEPAQIFVVRLK